MTERDYFFDKAVPRIIEERIAVRQRAQMPGPRRHPRRAIARGLHHLADRIDN
ncbi:MAG TPA: hypothetical protein VFT75_12110 [Nocardioidaceae bacterium]|jgi:hypothetical protein|nr:hypothetical protein [Nocardioidaceae bacterium]